jgi:hypothetical protein
MESHSTERQPHISESAINRDDANPSFGVDMRFVAGIIPLLTLQGSVAAVIDQRRRDVT